MKPDNSYPLIENLDKIKAQPLKNPEETLYAIVNVLDEEALTRWIDDNSGSSIPAEIRRQSKFRWDIADLVFRDTNVIQLIRKKQASDTVTKSHLLCVTLDEVFYDMAANLFYNFYSQDSGNGLTAIENNEIIKSIFGEQFERLDKAFEDWLVTHVADMLVVPPTLKRIDPVVYTENQINHYRNTYKDAFFIHHIEKAIQNVTSPND